MIICLGLFLFLLMDFETSLHWGKFTLEGIFIRDILARYWGIPITLLADSRGEMIYTRA